MNQAASTPRPPTPKTVVSLRDVSKQFSSGTLALEHLDLDIYQGEILSLLGPSGCGKSTALRIIAGLGDTSSGRLIWPGGGDDHSSDVGFVFQEPTLMPWATVFDNVRLPSRLKGISRKAAKDTVMQALDNVGLHAFADAYPRELSGGMRMRVSIARAMVTKPKLLLMDEPFAALDEITRQKLNDDLIRIQHELGWTVVFVTHSVFESVYISDRIVVMAARPGRAFAELIVDAPRPRTPEFRASAAYADYCRKASATLTAAIGKTAETVDGH
ncbi:ABC transporter ATP-binding protein [Labrys okinawensis]|uniref:ABC transporter ATP-binding protein n=1 Tax=Labrys okinawensis TaxID=346911 RepID=UPI0039BC6FB7